MLIFLLNLLCAIVPDPCTLPQTYPTPVTFLEKSSNLTYSTTTSRLDENPPFRIHLLEEEVENPIVNNTLENPGQNLDFDAFDFTEGVTENFDVRQNDLENLEVGGETSNHLIFRDRNGQEIELKLQENLDAEFDNEIGGNFNKRNISENSRPKIVSTRSGQIAGYFMTVLNGRKISAYEGIPYAEAPIGDLRFEDPLAKRPWSGVRPAFTKGPVCLQLHLIRAYMVLGSEDCLTLSIYSPRTNQVSPTINPRSGQDKSRKLLPTLIFIHGGSFFYGSGTEYGPAYLLQYNDIVMVTINYRLGPLGFLSTGDSNSPGNYGLKDQALAIKWVHENIEGFGGDPNNIVLMGQSAGSVSTHLHIMLAKEMGRDSYLRGGISLSGTAFNYWAVQTPEKASFWTKKLAKNLRCPIDSTKSMMDCIKGKSPHFIVAKQINLFDWLGAYPPILFAPVVESNHEIGPTTRSQDNNLPKSGGIFSRIMRRIFNRNQVKLVVPQNKPFLTQSPEEIYENNLVPRIPMIFNQVANEGDGGLIIMQAIGRLTTLRRHWDYLAPKMLDYNNYPEDQKTEITQKISSEYFTKRGETIETVDKRVFSDLLSGRYFLPGFHNAISAHSKVAPTFSSIFGYIGQIGIGPIFGFDAREFSVGHTEELGYIFNYSFFKPIVPSTMPGEYQISKLFTELISNFATYGEPLYKMGEKFVKIWRPNDELKRSSENLEYLQLNNSDIDMTPDTYARITEFWDSLNI